MPRHNPRQDRPGPAPPAGRPRTGQPKAGGPKAGGSRTGGPASGDDRRNTERWLYGHHAVAAALANPARTIRRLLATAAGHATLATHLTGGGAAALAATPPVDRTQLEAVLPPGAVHQGVALLADPLPEIDLSDLLQRAPAQALLLLLDRVTDPQNVGAVLRSAAAFGALGVVQPDRQAAPVTGALAKAASGALEVVPLVTVGNLARTLHQVQQAGFFCLGLDGAAATALDAAPAADRTGLVLGAEGSGLRRLTRDRCDMLVRLPTRPPITSLNVSAAAAVALFARRVPGPAPPR